MSEVLHGYTSVWQTKASRFTGGCVMDAATIAHALGGRKSGDGYRAACPCCGGSDGSTRFSIKDANGRVLVHCFAGCEFEAIAKELRSRGLWPEPDLPKKQIIKCRMEKERAELDEALLHDLVVLEQFLVMRIAGRRYKQTFRAQRPDYRPPPDATWEREELAIKRIRTALREIYD